MVKVIWRKAASPPRTDGTSYSPGGANVPSHEGTLAPIELVHIGATWRIRLNCASFGPPQSTTQAANRTFQPFLHSSRQSVVGHIIRTWNTYFCFRFRTKVLVSGRKWTFILAPFSFSTENVKRRLNLLSIGLGLGKFTWKKCVIAARLKSSVENSLQLTPGIFVEQNVGFCRNDAGFMNETHSAVKHASNKTLYSTFSDNETPVSFTNFLAFTSDDLIYMCLQRQLWILLPRKFYRMGALPGESKHIVIQNINKRIDTVMGGYSHLSPVGNFCVSFSLVLCARV